MITPRFRLEQDEGAVTVIIHAPFARVNDAEVFMENEDFRFHSEPYYLRLNLPGPVHETDDAKARYDVEKSSFIITCPKVNKGQVFQGLDMLTQLLQPKGKRNIEQPVLSVLDSSDGLDEDSSEAETEYDWFLEQNPRADDHSVNSIASVTNQFSYGFAQKHQGVFSSLTEELQTVVDVRLPDTKSCDEVREERISTENADFNVDHYVADFFQEDCIKPYLESKPFDDFLAKEWTDLELDYLKNLAKKEFLLDPTTLQSCYLGLVDILFGYCYDMRTTNGDHTVESAWTIAKLSGTLSWLEVFYNVKDVAVCCLRRSLCYPLFRNYKLSQRVLEDTETLLRQGPRVVLRCLIDIHQLFNACEPRYILNQLYIQDYSIWIQRTSEETLKSLADSLKTLNLSKDDLSLDLVRIEQEALCELFESSSSASESESEEPDFEEQFSRMKLGSKQIVPKDLRIAAQAAGDDRFEGDDEESLDSDDLSSEED